jgi:hypothetical protein
VWNCCYSLHPAFVPTILPALYKKNRPPYEEGRECIQLTRLTGRWQSEREAHLRLEGAVAALGIAASALNDAELADQDIVG